MYDTEINILKKVNYIHILTVIKCKKSIRSDDLTVLSCFKEKEERKKKQQP